MENGAFLGDDYFECLLEEIREIRLSERRFYQKITDIYATTMDTIAPDDCKGWIGHCGYGLP
jgi:hypothetical protein